MEIKLSLIESLKNVKTEDLMDAIDKLVLSNEEIFEIFMARNIDMDDYNEHL